MVIERSDSFIETAGMPRIKKSEPLKIQVMTELVTKRAKERSERGDFLLNGGPHPNSNEHGLRAIIPEQFACPVLANSQGPSREDANATFRNFVEL